MKIVYASRTGNVESIIEALDLEDTIKIDMEEKGIDDEFILFTYTDGYGDVPREVEDFLQKNHQYLKGVIVSGDKNYGEAFCQAGDTISLKYHVPCFYKVENEGTEEDIRKIKKVIQKYV